MARRINNWSLLIIIKVYSWISAGSHQLNFILRFYTGRHVTCETFTIVFQEFSTLGITIQTRFCIAKYILLLLKGPISFPFVGCAIQMGFLLRKFKHFKMFEEMCRRYGSVIGMQAGRQYTGNLHIYIYICHWNSSKTNLRILV